MIIFIAFLYFILFLIPGFSSLIYLRNKFKLDSIDSFVLSVILSFVITYISFFIFFCNSTIGNFFVFIIVIISFIYIVNNLDKSLFLYNAIFFDIKLLFILYILYISITLSYDISINSRYTWLLPIDNQLPWDLADCLFNKNDHIKKCFQKDGFWRSSDRPPLFSSAILFLLPFKMSWISNEQFYQYNGALLQCTWINGALLLAKSLALKKNHIRYLLLSLIFSGVFLLNSVFLWPKLITVLPFSYSYKILISESKAKNNISTSEVIAFISISLAYLFHGGILFSIIALFTVWSLYHLYNKNIYIFFKVIPLFLISLIILLPWTIYQKKYDPPGDSLFKLRIAGQRNLDDPVLYRNHPMFNLNQSLYSAIDYSYNKVPTEDIIINKLENLKTVFEIWIPSIEELRNLLYISILNIRGRQFFYTLDSADFLLIGIFLLPLSIYRSSRNLRKQVIYIICIFSLSLILWILLMFEPRATIIHQGSYMNLIFLFILLTMGLSVNYWIAFLLLLLHFIIFLSWIPPYEIGIVYNEFYAISAILSGISIIVLLMRPRTQIYHEN